MLLARSSPASESPSDPSTQRPADHTVPPRGGPDNRRSPLFQVSGSAVIILSAMLIPLPCRSTYSTFHRPGDNIIGGLPPGSIPALQSGPGIPQNSIPCLSGCCPNMCNSASSTACLSTLGDTIHLTQRHHADQGLSCFYLRKHKRLYILPRCSHASELLGSERHSDQASWVVVIAPKVYRGSDGLEGILVTSKGTGKSPAAHVSLIPAFLVLESTETGKEVRGRRHAGAGDTTCGALQLRAKAGLLTNVHRLSRH